MMISRTSRFAHSLLAAALWLAPTAAQAQTTAPPFFPLEITNIGPVGVNRMHSDNRIFRAYPGIEYNIRAAVVGGAFPYTYSLGNAPAGMTINASTGTIIWPNPQADAPNVTLTVQDSAGATRSATWNIDVTTTGFKFVDAVNGRNAANNGCSSSCGAGTVANPWRTIGDLALNDSVSDITYFRNGTYNAVDAPASIKVNGGPWQHIAFSDRADSSAPGSVMWVAYPGESPRIDFGYRAGGSAGYMIRFNGVSAYVDGFEAVNAQFIGFQFGGGRGPTFRRLRMHNLGPGGDGTNSAFIMTQSSYPEVAYGLVIQDSHFYDVLINDSDAAVTLKLYSVIKPLIEDTVQYNAMKATELKADVRQFTVRNNTFYNLTATAIGGNMHGCVSCGEGGSDMMTSGGEILFNNVRSGNPAILVNQDGQATRVHVHRNTFRGRVQVQSTDGSDGPFYFSNNVIVNSDSGTPSGSHIYHYNVTAPSRIVLANNLVGSSGDNIIDANGNLTSAYSQHLGTRGFQRGAGTVPPPSAPSNVRIIGQ